MKGGQMASQATIDAALAFKTAMQAKTIRRVQLVAAVNNDNTLTAAEKLSVAAQAQADVAVHEDWYELGTQILPIQFPQGGGT